MINKKILVVDDDDSIRDALCDVLKSAGYEVRFATNGQSALEVLSTSFKPDLIFLDILMPVMDGRQFIQVVKEVQDLALIPIVVTTASAHRNTVQGANAILKKPYDIDAILQVAELYCGSRVTADA